MSELEASIYNLEEYIQATYEDKMELKIASARKILRLTLEMSNIEYIIKHGNNQLIFLNYYLLDTLINALSRLLKEEYKKSLELCIILLCIFYVFSNYQIYHGILIEVYIY